MAIKPAGAIGGGSIHPQPGINSEGAGLISKIGVESQFKTVAVTIESGAPEPNLLSSVRIRVLPAGVAVLPVWSIKDAELSAPSQCNKREWVATVQVKGAAAGVKLLI